MSTQDYMPFDDGEDNKLRFLQEFRKISDPYLWQHGLLMGGCSTIDDKPKMMNIIICYVDFSSTEKNKSCVVY